MHKARKALGLAPWPNNVRLTGGGLTLPDRSIVSYGPAGRTMRFAAEAIARAIRATARQAELRYVDDRDGCYLLVTGFAGRYPRLSPPAGAEAYEIRIADDVEVRAETPTGAFYGAQTLVQAISAGQGTLPKCEIGDRPRIAFRGVMADLARLKERDDYYFKLIDFMSRYKFNAIFLHLTDDQGAPIELQSHPKLTSAHPLTRETIERLIDYAAQRHIDVIPEIEVWGHAGWVTKHPEYADIAEEGPDLCTTNPRTWQLIGDVLDDICSLFSSKYIHGGSDEAHFGRCPKCKAEVEAHGEDTLVGNHLKRTAELIRERGRVPILWADILLKYPGSADIVPKYAILNHWDYAASPSDEPVKLLKSKGFTVLGGSGIVFGSRAVLPKGDALRNVENFGQITRKHGIMGINNTIWIPQRYVSDTLWYGIALAGEASWSGAKPDRAGFTVSFFKSFFGIDAGPDLVEAIATLHELPAYVGDSVMGVWQDKKEFDELATPEQHSQKEAYLSSALDVLAVVRKYRASVVRRRWEYDALVYAARMKRHIGERSAAPGRLVAAIESARKLAAEGKAAAAAGKLLAQAQYLARLSEQERRMASATEKYWDRWRYAEDPRKAEPFQNTLNAFKTSAGYLNTLAARLTEAARELSQGRQPDWERVSDERSVLSAE
ncbi:MAG: family 20 glycosylhydrolase [Armatimonadota bacterium]|nr:family 20 glycosylhydrolase [Armatimonadota bacterium]